ncbi:unnamed protein product, partial [Urochloa humidicola]
QINDDEVEQWIVIFKILVTLVDQLKHAVIVSWHTEDI